LFTRVSVDWGNHFYSVHSDSAFKLHHGLNAEHLADITECLLGLQVVREAATKAKLPTISCTNCT
jgi:hypothetical protein